MLDVASSPVRILALTLVNLPLLLLLLEDQRSLPIAEKSTGEGADPPQRECSLVHGLQRDGAKELHSLGPNMVELASSSTSDKVSDRGERKVAARTRCR